MTRVPRQTNGLSVVFRISHSNEAVRPLTGEKEQQYQLLLKFTPVHTRPTRVSIIHRSEKLPLAQPPVLIERLRDTKVTKLLLPHRGRKAGPHPDVVSRSHTAFFRLHLGWGKKGLDRLA